MGESNEQQSEYITAGQARAMLGVSRPKMAKMMRAKGDRDGEGALEVKPDPLDARVKWVRRADVERILSESRIPKKEAA